MKKAKTKVLQVYYDRYIFFKALFILMGILIIVYLLKIYLIHIDKTANKLADNTDTTYVLDKPTKLESNMYFIDLEKDMNKFIKSEKQNTIAYKINGEKFYLDVKIYRDKEKKTKSYEVVKIIDQLHNMKAKVNFTDVKTVEFRTEEQNGPTVVKLVSEDQTEYYAITNDTYFSLGEDIDDITFDDGRFYYKTINPKYESDELKKNGCTQKVIDSIEEFNFKEPYYSYGRVSFLNDYYEKVVEGTFSVENECKLLAK